MQTLEELSIQMREHHARLQSWRKTGAIFGLNPAMARLIALGYEPGRRVREQLGLPPAASVVPVAGAVPDGTQVAAATRCSCGRWFVSNHPRRKRCFICSPYKGKKI